MKLKKFLIISTMLFLFKPENVYAKEIKIPSEVIQISEELGTQYNICPELIQAICFKESSFDPDVENDGCVGIMQVNPKWHQDRMDRLLVNDILDLKQNMMVAVDYISELAGEEIDIAEVLMKYHGESKISEKLEAGEISKYAEEVLELSAELERKNGK